jgi:hypothetical protein
VRLQLGDAVIMAASSTDAATTPTFTVASSADVATDTSQTYL